MVKIKIQTSTREELAEVAKTLRTLGIAQRGTIKSDGFSFNGKFTSTDTKNDEKTKG